MASEALTSTGYIKHHLQNWTYGQHPDGHWGFAHSAAEAKGMGFMAVHVDTMLWSIVLGTMFLWLFRKAAVKATADTPSGLQNFVEWIAEFIDTSVRGSSGCTNGDDDFRLGLSDELDGFSTCRLVASIGWLGRFNVLWR